MDISREGSARAWATGARAGSATAKLILMLLADKADEADAGHSCAPSIGSLVAESGAGRSTVLRALKELQTRGLISRHPQFGDDGAQRTTRYCLNRPAAKPLSSAAIEITPPTAPSPSTHAPTVARASGADSRWDSLPLLLPIPRAAQLLGISTTKAYRWVARGDLPARRLGSRVYIQTDRLRSLLEVPRAGIAASRN